jgi:hypothetical protein
VRLPSWLPLGDYVFHASTYERNIIPLASHSLREKIVSFKFSKAEGRVHQLGFVSLLVFFFSRMKWVCPLPWMHCDSPTDPCRSLWDHQNLLATLGSSWFGSPLLGHPNQWCAPVHICAPEESFLRSRAMACVVTFSCRSPSWADQLCTYFIIYHFTIVANRYHSPSPCYQYQQW